MITLLYDYLVLWATAIAITFLAIGVPGLVIAFFTAGPRATPAERLLRWIKRKIL